MRACLCVQAGGHVGGDWCESVFASVCTGDAVCVEFVLVCETRGGGGNHCVVCVSTGENNKMTTVSDKELVCA